MTVEQLTIDDMLAGRLDGVCPDVRAKRRLALTAMRDVCGVNGKPVEAWRVSECAQRIQHKRYPAAAPMGESTIRTRLNELCKLGYVRVADKDGLTRSHNKCGRYALTKAGVEMMARLSDDE
ncbi:hypothetical protein [Bifidobacterium bombi]|uniref:Uncharacterized protein n=1 Tax=Bifidobacterium bombi DSM 19703 TaxID=1341695 RepID=A0A080N6J2_9BIFI|nr:hypothetical protein [Bifidobacterium bombi]KFF31674.1 hypothetical protein BBOMB_1061 [Bifidobacterium bombi DSM 19703]